MVAALLALALAGPAGAADAPSASSAAGPAPVSEAAEPAPRSKMAGFGAPLVTYDSNTKLGGGAFGQLVFADPSGLQPFKASVAAQGYATTGGYQSHYVSWDLPALGGSRWRIGGEVRRLVWTQAPFFGLGNDTPRVDPTVDPDFHQWEQRSWRTRLTARRSLRGSSWELYGGYDLRFQSITRLPGSQLELERPQGAGGGRMAWAQVGAFYDTRTNEIDPYDGVALDFAGRSAGPWFGSDWIATGMHTSARRWWAPHQRVILAGRVMADAVWGAPPFFTRAHLGGLSNTIVGGGTLLRGLPSARLRGDAVFALQGEVRFRVGAATVLRKVDLSFMLVPFVDAAQVVVWDEPDEGLDPHVTAGGGLRINANDLLVVRADLGVGVERYRDDPTRRPLIQFYLLSEHPF